MNHTYIKNANFTGQPIFSLVSFYVNDSSEIPFPSFQICLVVPAIYRVGDKDQTPTSG
jgi:hypothetical protein